MENLVFQQAHWVLTRVLQIQIKTFDLSLWFSNNNGIIVGDGCTGLKQFIQVFLLFLIYPGPWKHKAWFIPTGILVMHITNIVRITLLGIAMNLNFPKIHFIHSYILRLLFYVVIFALWWIWEEKIRTRHVTNQNPT
jgi:exosortase/archaeosortase family protein